MRDLSKSSNNKIHITNAWHALFTSSVFKYFGSLFFLLLCEQSSLLNSWMRTTFCIYSRLLSCQTWIKKMETHWGCIVWMRGIQHLDLFLIQTWTTFKMLVLVSFHTLNKNKIPPVGRWKHFFFFFYAAFLKIQSFYVNGLFSEAQFNFFVLFLVSLIHSLFCGPVN